jgi:hypothetical protein
MVTIRGLVAVRAEPDMGHAQTGHVGQGTPKMYPTFDDIDDIITPIRKVYLAVRTT